MIDESEFREIYRFYLGHIPREDEFQKEWARLDFRGEQKASRSAYILWLQTSTNPVFKQHAPTEVLSPHKGAERFPGASGSIASVKVRPKWNQRFNAGANSNFHCPRAQRQYFSRPQSLPELARYFETHRGHQKSLSRLAQPDPPKKMVVLSNDSGVEMKHRSQILPPRSSPGGSMRDRRTGKVQLWRDYWQTPASVREKYQPGTLDLRCMGPPPAPSIHVDD